MTDVPEAGSSRDPDESETAIGRRTFLVGAGAVTAASIRSPLSSKNAETAETGASDLTGVRGAMYLPSKDWNAYQMWANYEPRVIERELDMAASLGLDSLRVLGSYYHWKEDGVAFFERAEHFLTECRRRDIRPLVILFEAPPKNEPTEYNRTTTDPADAFGVHSPSWSDVIGPRNWSGYDRSPLHFARRWARTYATDPRLLATEIMNEPGDVQPRQDFVKDALATVRREAPSATLTMGCRDVRYNRVYDENDDLDVHQFHMNLPVDGGAAEDQLAEAKRHREETEKPLWCTEWQRTREGPRNRFLPNPKSLEPIIEEAHVEGAIDGDFLWGLMLKPAYLRQPRRDGRVNGLFHEDGTLFDATGRGEPERTELSLPDAWESHPFPYPDPQASSGG